MRRLALTFSVYFAVNIAIFKLYLTNENYSVYWFFLMIIISFNLSTPSLYLFDKFFFCRWVRHKFSSEQVLVIFQYRVFYNGFVSVSTKNNADCRVIAFRLFEIVKHTAVHIHLADVLMFELPAFQIDQQKTF